MIQKSIRRLLFNLTPFQFSSIKQFKLPDLGEKIKEATIKQWHVKVGDKIEEFQPVADVATDKMFTQIPSSYTGIVHRIFHQVEEECQVGELFLEVEIEDSNNKKIQQSESDEEEQLSQNNQNNKNINNHQEFKIDSDQVSGILATPSIRRQAKDLGVDINLVKGTGKPDGRILAIDIENFINQSHNNNKIEQKVESKQVPEEQIHKKLTTAANINISEVKQNYEEVKMSNFQKGMQKSMTKSGEIPHLYLMDEFDITSMGLLREELKKQLGVPITFFSLFVKAFSLALLKYPIMNSHYDPNKPFEYRTFKSHNISLALDTPQGLIVPNIKDCQNLSIFDIHKELDRLKNLGNKGALLQQDIIDGTICLSNIGTIGGTYTGPLILPPQICIVGLGRARTLPRYDHNLNLVPKKIMNVSFGCDHRIVDGATVTRFSNQWKNYIENPFSMLSNLS